MADRKLSEREREREREREGERRPETLHLSTPCPK
jgi:hypothetical protein